MILYHSFLLVVEDIIRSRQFYENVLGQKVRFDFGVDIEFEGPFSIHQRSDFETLLGGQRPVSFKTHNTELYFDTDDLEDSLARLNAAGVELVHGVVEQPWSQRVIRLYDPDGHLIEIGETMDVVVLRLHRHGLPVEEIHRKCAMPIDYIQRVIAEQAGDSAPIP